MLGDAQIPGAAVSALLAGGVVLRGLQLGGEVVLDVVVDDDGLGGGGVERDGAEPAECEGD